MSITAPPATTTTELVARGKIVIHLQAATASVRLTRLDGDGIQVPHTDVTITWSPVHAPTARIPGRLALLGPVATAARLELTCAQARRVQRATEDLLAAAWDRFGTTTETPAEWLAIRDADGQMRATSAHTLVADLADWCTPDQAGDLHHLHAETSTGRPSISTQRRLGILLVPVHAPTAQDPA